MRRIEIHVTEEQIQDLSRDERQKLEAAIQRLATWAMFSERYSHCYIYPDRKLPDLIACYFDGPRSNDNGEPVGKLTFQMGAVWRKDRNEYSFHS